MEQTILHVYRVSNLERGNKQSTRDRRRKNGEGAGGEGGTDDCARFPCLESCSKTPKGQGTWDRKRGGGGRGRGVEQVLCTFFVLEKYDHAFFLREGGEEGGGGGVLPQRAEGIVTIIRARI